MKERKYVIKILLLFLALMPFLVDAQEKLDELHILMEESEYLHRNFEKGRILIRRPPSFLIHSYRHGFKLSEYSLVHMDSLKKLDLKSAKWIAELPNSFEMPMTERLRRNIAFDIAGGDLSFVYKKIYFVEIDSSSNTAKIYSAKHSVSIE
jgi:hypothetical protein